MSIVAVAKKAGVSVATVSRVLNDLQNVRPETVEQVRAAMAEIGYKPPRVKRGPKGGPRRTVPACMRTGQIAVLTLGAFQNWLGLPVMASVVAGVTRAAKDLDIRPVLDEMPDPTAITSIVRRREVDGAIVFVTAGVPDERLLPLREHVPVVWVMGGQGGAVEVDHVSADNVGIGRLAASYLADKRCETVAYITDHPSWQIMRLRGQAFGDASRDMAAQVTNYLVSNDSRERESYGGDVVAAQTLEDVVDRITRAKPRPTGLFVPTDLLTTQVYPLLIQRGVRPGTDIQIISCDNEEERLAMLVPRPPSIDIRGEEIGRWAVRQLIQRIQHPDEPAAQVQLAPRIAPTTPAD